MSVEMAMALSMSERDAVPPEESSISTTGRKRARKGTSSSIESNGPMTDSEREAWDRVKGLLRKVQDKDRQLKDSMNLLMDVQRQLQESVHKFEDFKSDFEIPAMSLVRIDKHKRKRGKKLSMDERRAVKHLHEVCVLEKLNGKYVATGSPILRTSLYLGMSPKTISDVLDEKGLIDLRGQYTRTGTACAFASDLRQYTLDMNLTGRVVTVMRLHKRLMDSWPTDIVIPGRETIRRTMHAMKLGYKKVSKTRNYIETADIKAKRSYYLRERESDKFKDALFVWLDESYCNQHHVNSMVSWICIACFHQSCFNRSVTYYNTCQCNASRGMPKVTR